MAAKPNAAHGSAPATSANGAHGVAPDVPEAAASERGIQPHVGRRGSAVKVKPESTVLKLADVTVTAISSSDAGNQWLVAIHERFGDDALADRARRLRRDRRRRRQRQRLLAQDVFAGIERAERPLDVQRVRQRDVDRIDTAIAQQRVVAAVSDRDIPVACVVSRPGGVAAGDGRQHPSGAPRAWPESGAG